MELVLQLGFVIGASLLLAVEPGPGFIKIAHETARGGKIAGRLAAIGMAVGALPHIALVAFGMMAILTQLPGLLWALKAAGGAYLIWQAASMARARPVREKPPDDGVADSAGRRSSFVGGFLLVALNPRTPVLYAAFLPLFLRTEVAMPVASQLLVLGGIVSMVFLVVDLFFVNFAQSAISRVRGWPRVVKWARYAGGSLMAAFGLRLILSRD